MRRKHGLATLFAMMMTAGVAATVTFDSQTGTGFVGKGDVQVVFGWNNAQLQNNAHLVQFQYDSSVTETWTCSRPTPNPNDTETERQYNNRHMQQAINGAPNADPRQKKGQQQFTGFILSGYAGDAVIEDGGHAPNSCPSGEGADWTYDEGSNVIDQTGGGLQVSINGVDWFDLQ